MLDGAERGRLPASSRPGSRRTSSSASRCYGEFTRPRRRPRAAQRARALARARRRRRAPAARPATSIRRVERMQVKVSGLIDERYVVTCNGRRCRCSRPATTANSSPACATAPGSRRRACIRRSASTRRSCSTCSTPGWSARSAAARTTSRIPAAVSYDDVSRQRLRSRRPPPRPLLPHRPHARDAWSLPASRKPRISRHARPAPPTVPA